MFKNLVVLAFCVTSQIDVL